MFGKLPAKFQLTESHTAANAVFYDVLTRKDRADATRNALSILTRFRFIFFLSSSIDQNLAKVTQLIFSQNLSCYLNFGSSFESLNLCLAYTSFQ